MKKRITAVVIILAMLISTLSGCGTPASAADLMSGVKSKDVKSETDLTGTYAVQIDDFAVRLFQNCVPADKNTLISPISVLSALAMTANGAGGNTLSQMESVFGLSVPELNDYIHAYMKELPSGGKYKVSIANSIWFKDDKSFKVNKDFLQSNADYYGASIFKTAFNYTTLKEINNWVDMKTGGTIKNIINNNPSSTVMCLINALAFDAEWQEIYKKSQISNGKFTSVSGDIRNVDMMNSMESIYLDNGFVTGFIKYYADKKYAFAALLPNEGISLNNCIKSLSGSGLYNTIKNAESTPVGVAIPKFTSEYSIEMSDILKSIGMTDAFNGNKADFSKICASDSGNIFISRVIHKTYIDVDEKGTKAGAATAVELEKGSMLKSKTVNLDRPFVYMIIDCGTNLPLFIGTVTDIANNYK